MRQAARSKMTTDTTDTIGTMLMGAIAQLIKITDSPQLEAELLLCAVLKCSRTFLLAHPEIVLDDVQVSHYTTMLARRMSNEPLPYITGHIEFYGLDLAVSPAVLIPRSETELLVALALERLQEQPNATWVDVGTGSGCIAVTLAKHALSARGIAVDVSAAALTVAHGNAVRHKVAERIAWVQGDVLSPVVAPVDVLVSNPPYVTDTEWVDLPPSVQQEPRLALTAGADGLTLIRRLLQQATQRLKPNGLMLVEMGEKQGNVAQALAQATFPDAKVDIVQDLAGKPRVLRVERDSRFSRRNRES